MSHKRLADIANIVMGQSPPGSTCNRNGSGIPLLNGPTEFGSHHPVPEQFTTDARKQAINGDLLFCVRGSTTGRMNWADQQYAIGRGVAAIRHRDNTRLQPFIRGVVELQLPYLLQSATGSTFPNVSARQLADLYIPDLPEEAQIRISQLLGSIQDKIDLNRKMNVTLEDMARIIFKDWFVDFGPVRAKAEGRQPPGLAPEIAALFPDALDDDDKPVGWHSGVLADVAISPRRGVSPAEVSVDTPYIGLEHMPRRAVALSDWAGAGKVTSNKSAFERGEFLFGKLRPYFHKVGVAPVDGICSTDIVVVKQRAREWEVFVLACISSEEFVSFTDQTSTGTKMPRTSWKEMGRFPIYIPSREVAEAYQIAAHSMIERIVANVHESRTLAELRGMLLPKLMTGEIRIRDAEKAIETAA